LSRPDPGTVDPQWRTHVPGLIAWVQTTFGKGPYYSAQAIDEQTWCCSINGLGSHTSRWASVNALWYQRTGDATYKENAYRAFNYATYFAREDGVIMAVFFDGSPWYTDGYADYIRHFMAGMAAVPEWAPPAEDHLLYSTSVVQTITYAAGQIAYRTFDASAIETLRISFTPSQVWADGMLLPRRNDLSQPGWVFDPVLGVLQIRHDNAAHVLILGPAFATPTPTPVAATATPTATATPWRAPYRVYLPLILK